MGEVEDFKKKLQSDKSARDKFAADISDVLKRHGVSVDSSKISSQLQGGPGGSSSDFSNITLITG